LGAKLNDYDTSILDSVWSAFLRLATEYPADAAVMMTLQYHGWYLDQCLQLSLSLE